MKRIASRGTLWIMREPQDRLRYIRRLRGFETATDAARHFNWSIPTYKSAENGIRPMTRDTAYDYAKAFRVRPGWLLYGEGDWNTSPTNYGKTDLAFSTIPSLDWEIVTHSENIRDVIEQAKHAQSLQQDIELGPLAFRLRNKDESMIDVQRREKHSFLPGDELIFDPELKITPACYVLARIFPKNITVFRQYWERGVDNDGRKIITLHAFNPAWPDENIISGESGEIIARLARRIDTHS